MPQLDARAAVSTYIIFGTIFGFPLALALLLKTDPSVELVFGALFLLALIWIRSYRIVFDGRVISYSTMLGRTRSIALNSIESAKTEIGREGPFDPMYRLKLDGSAATDTIVINMKVFERDDLHRLFAILGPKMVHRPQLDMFEKRKRNRRVD